MLHDRYESTLFLVRRECPFVSRSWALERGGGAVEERPWTRSLPRLLGGIRWEVAVERELGLVCVARRGRALS